MRKKIQKYYELAKPGIIYGNLITAIGGFLFASSLAGRFDFRLFLAMIVGTSLVIGSACVFNNYTDRVIDLKMERTKNRALAEGSISGRNAITYANIIGIIGIAVLFYFTNARTAYLEIFGLFAYVVLYGLAKRRTVHGVTVGTLPGAVPVVAGYCAVADRFDFAALILFVILVLWQMPHFYGIALRRADEYKAAGIPVLPLRKGIRRTKIEMLLYVILFFFAALLPTLFGYTGWIYFGVMAAVDTVWVLIAVHGFDAAITEGTAVSKWGRKMFLYSLVVILVFSVMISVGALIS